jgi:hypothetical protein
VELNSVEGKTGTGDKGIVDVRRGEAAPPAASTAPAKK